ncbi:hypothetical protein B0T19DRAFT_480095 [Cercophora scortea]|uniref:Clr5 domain-containing protein n=1 Tax=Cercophora scortea TaxID=314031 RepID=A0AAE0MKC5_9PEZI|nr:hypothetical protein B0T19DRAFT_480095 [Cercophora scortea]
MVYEWDAHRETCYLLYVQEKRSLDEVIEYLAAHHSFTPSRRAFQTQFKKWEFPTKHNPAYKNEALVARVRELWERNLKQKEMLKVLVEEDGFTIEPRELTRLRNKHGLRLRQPGTGFGLNNPPKASQQRPRSGEGEDDSEPGSVSGSESGSEESDDQSERAEDGASPAEDLTPERIAKREERKRALEAQSFEKWSTKKRRRRTRGWAGMPADPPGPPRFPSETTLNESKVILQLDTKAYTAVRRSFQKLCEDAGVLKKTDAGPEKWEGLKEELVRGSTHLRSLMWDSENMDKKKLAIDVIACDVTKRMRFVSSLMTIAEAKTILGLNPEEGREIRSALYKILLDDKFTCKLEEGLEQWQVIKEKWYASTTLFERLITTPETDPDHHRKSKALEFLARDALRRYRDDVGHTGTQKANKKIGVPKTKGPENHSADTGAAGVGGHGADATQLAPPIPVILAHTEPRLLPLTAPPVMTPQPDLSSIDPHMDNALLLSPDTEHAFVDDQYVHGYTPAQPAPVYQQPAQQSTIAVYFRLHPTSTFQPPQSFPGAIPMWISTLSSRSMVDLRNAAASKYQAVGQGVMCLAVEGIVKDDKGNEVPLPVNDDVELETYLQHVQSAPMFSVQLVEGQRGWV